MNSSNFGILPILLQQGLFALPSLLIYVIALGLAILNLGRYPRPAWFTLVGSTLLLVANLLLLVVRAYLFANQGASGLEMVRTMQILGFVDVTVDFFGMLMIVSSIFLDRVPTGAALPTYATPVAANYPPPRGPA